MARNEWDTSRQICANTDDKLVVVSPGRWRQVAIGEPGPRPPGHVHLSISIRAAPIRAPIRASAGRCPPPPPPSLQADRRSAPGIRAMFSESGPFAAVLEIRRVSAYGSPGRGLTPVDAGERHRASALAKSKRDGACARTADGQSLQRSANYSIQVEQTSNNIGKQAETHLTAQSIGASGGSVEGVV
ncbi:hypothetical protein C8R44DRAFT_740344 [Mycena epipterygia]|nr:hypothetical protein C8R44DRAFT_740344 [Mycena epipterygia]